MMNDPRMMGRMLMNRGMPQGMQGGMPRGGMPGGAMPMMPTQGSPTGATPTTPPPGILNGFEMDPKKGLQTPEDMQRLMQFIGSMNNGMVQNPGS